MIPPLFGRRMVPVFVVFCVVAGSSVADAQRTDTPSMGYFTAFRDFYDGEYRDALDRFKFEGRGAVKTATARWIDSICYETMVGECHYQMGNLSESLDHYTAALRLYAAYSDWMIRVEFSPAIQPSTAGRQVPWGVSTRRSRLGHYPETTLSAQGRINNNEQIKRGGVVQQPFLYPIHVQEIVRCTTLAMRRRRQLLGPVGVHDALTSQLITVLLRRPGPPNHWSGAWIDVQLGIALSAGGKNSRAVPYLQRAVVAAGEFDHPLTSTALLELGRIALIGGNYDAASKYFIEATYSAYHYFNPDILEEAFRQGALTHLLANRRGMYPPLAAAIEWANVKKDLGQLHASLLLLAAENFAVMNQTSQAARLLAEARMVTARRHMKAGRMGTRLNFIGALVSFQQSNIAEGDRLLAATMNAMRRGSFWLFHISLADGLYTSGTITPRVAMGLYDKVLRDPQPADWASDPMESMAVLLTPHPLPIERWFEVALQRKAHEKALEISDRARRHRFFSSLAFGGRLQSLRWILEGPNEVLGKAAGLRRRELLTRYPGFDQLSRQSRALRAKLATMPLVAEDADMLKQQGTALAELAAVSLHQEAILREMAVRREPAELVFPPLRSTTEIQESLPDGHALLAFFATSRHLYGFLLNNKKYTYWQIGPPVALKKRVVKLLRDMGHFQQNHELTIDDLAKDGWKESSQQLLDLILKGSHADFTKKFDELVVVPDGVLWYVPFEALQVKVDDKLRPLISRVRVRYAPTVSLATSNRVGRKPAGNTAVVTGQLYPRDKDSVALEAFEKIAKVVPGSVALKATLPAPSAVFASTFDRLIVLDDLNLAGELPYAWAPVPIDRGRPGSSLSDWLSLPWGAPDEIILPGYHTAAEDSLKRAGGAAAGNEIFLSVCGLMSSGARTLLLSRWRTGGQNSFDLVREFAQELPHTSPADAWQRSVFLATRSRLNLEAEPRIRRSADVEPPRAQHPFFWAGYMLVDSGQPEKKPESQPDDLPAVLKPAAK